MNYVDPSGNVYIVDTQALIDAGYMDEGQYTYTTEEFLRDLKILISKNSTWSERGSTLLNIIGCDDALSLQNTPAIGLMKGNIIKNTVQESPDFFKQLIKKVKVIRHKEIKSPTPVKTENAIQHWDDFLGEGSYTNKNPITGEIDANRIFSANGTRSIRFGKHEMSKMGTGKFHYHEEQWIYEPIKNIMNYYNTLRRVQR